VTAPFSPARARPAWLPGWLYWPLAVLRAARPRQWPKNLLVFAAPLAADSLGRDDGPAYALVAAAAFCAASVAVYLVNDVLDVERDRRHPVKRHRPIAAGEVRRSHAVAIAVLCAAAAIAAGPVVRVPLLALIVAGYLGLSLLYSVVLKHLPVLELLFVASGFMLRVLGGAAATRVVPSVWFLLVCSLGALLVATAKRFTELTVLGDQAVRHRPAMRWYRPAALRLTQWVTAVAMLITYTLWALGEHGAWLRGWHLVSAVPLAAALARFGQLTARPTVRPVEDLLTRDAAMAGFELAWLFSFAAGLLQFGQLSVYEKGNAWLRSPGRNGC
jgi:decaprenyl-phosphate phosphoribosyltransferase